MLAASVEADQQLAGNVRSRGAVVVGGLSDSGRREGSR